MKLLHRVLLRIAYRLALAYWFIFRPTEGAAYVAVWVGDRVLTIKNSYKPCWTMPAGLSKANESSADTAAREMLEEVGIEVNAADLRLVDTFVSRSEYKTDRSTVFEIEFDSEPCLNLDGTEVVDAEFISFDELCARKPNLAGIVALYVDWKLAERESRSQTDCDEMEPTPAALLPASVIEIDGSMSPTIA